MRSGTSKINGVVHPPSAQHVLNPIFLDQHSHKSSRRSVHASGIHTAAPKITRHLTDHEIHMLRCNPADCMCSLGVEIGFGKPDISYFQQKKRFYLIEVPHDKQEQIAALVRANLSNSQNSTVVQTQPEVVYEQKDKNNAIPRSISEKNIVLDDSNDTLHPEIQDSLLIRLGMGRNSISSVDSCNTLVQLAGEHSFDHNDLRVLEESNEPFDLASTQLMLRKNKNQSPIATKSTHSAPDHIFTPHKFSSIKFGLTPIDSGDVVSTVENKKSEAREAASLSDTEVVQPRSQIESVGATPKGASASDSEWGSEFIEKNYLSADIQELKDAQDKENESTNVVDAKHEIVGEESDIIDPNPDIRSRRRLSKTSNKLDDSMRRVDIWWTTLLAQSAYSPTHRHISSCVIQDTRTMKYQLLCKGAPKVSTLSMEESKFSLHVSFSYLTFPSSLFPFS